MSDLVALAYPDRATAEKVRDELPQLTREHVIEIEDAVVVTRDSNGDGPPVPARHALRGPVTAEGSTPLSGLGSSLADSPPHAPST